MRARAFPRVGDVVTVEFLATRVSGVIEHIDDDSRRLQIVTEEGDSITFTLSRATGRFASSEDPSARLLFTGVQSDRRVRPPRDGQLKLAAIPQGSQSGGGGVIDST